LSPISFRSVLIAGILVVLLAVGGSALVSSSIVANDASSVESTGTPSTDGSDGTDGAAGEDGRAGPTGAQGPTGPRGVAGANGDDGATGATGPTGLTGAQGPSGLPGPRGLQGAAAFSLPTYEVFANAQDITTGVPIDIPNAVVSQSTPLFTPVGSGSTVEVQTAGLYRIEYYLRAEGDAGNTVHVYLDAGDVDFESGTIFREANAGSSHLYSFTMVETSVVSLDAFERIAVTMTTSDWSTELQTFWMRIEKIA
jgi:hypothetical protein